MPRNLARMILMPFTYAGMCAAWRSLGLSTEGPTNEATIFMMMVMMAAAVHLTNLVVPAKTARDTKP